MALLKLSQLKTVGNFIGKNWEKLPTIVATGKEISDAIKGKKVTGYVDQFTQAARDTANAGKDAAKDVDTIKTVVVGVGVVIAIIVVIFIMKKSKG